MEGSKKEKELEREVEREEPREGGREQEYNNNEYNLKYVGERLLLIQCFPEGFPLPTHTLRGAESPAHTHPLLED